MTPDNTHTSGRGSGFTRDAYLAHERARASIHDRHHEDYGCTRPRGCPATLADTPLLAMEGVTVHDAVDLSGMMAERRAGR
ncbi:MAG: hypothetical protein WBF53_06395 [Litorimonas sp.]